MLEFVPIKLGEGSTWEKSLLAFTSCTYHSLNMFQLPVVALLPVRTQSTKSLIGVAARPPISETSECTFCGSSCECVKGSSINTASFPLAGFISYLLIYWAETVLENATRPSTHCQQLPDKRNFSCFAVWHQYTHVVQIIRVLLARAKAL